MQRLLQLVGIVVLSASLAFASGGGANSGGGGGTATGSGGGTTGGGATGGGGGGTTVTPTPLPNPATAVPGQILIRESFGFGPNGQRPAGGGGKLKVVNVHTSLPGFWAEYPANPAETWISQAASTTETWGFSATSVNTKEAPTPYQPLPDQNGTVSNIVAAGPEGHAAALLPFSAPPIPYEVSMDVLPYPSFSNGNILAVGFTSSPVLFSNFESTGQAWMLIRWTDFPNDQFSMTVELHTNGLNGPSVSAPVFLNVFDTLTVRYDPSNQLVSGYFNDQFIGSLPYTATPVTFVGFEGEGTVDNFVVKASN